MDHSRLVLPAEITEADVELVKQQVSQEGRHTLCSDSCLHTIAEYRTYNIYLVKHSNQRENLLQEYKKIEKILQKQIRTLQEDLRIASLKINEKQLMLDDAELRVEKAMIETTRVQSRLEKVVASKAILDELQHKQPNPGKSGLGYHAVQAPFNNNMFVMPTVKKSHELELEVEDDKEIPLCKLHKINRETSISNQVLETGNTSDDTSATTDEDEYRELAPGILVKYTSHELKLKRELEARQLKEENDQKILSQNSYSIYYPFADISEVPIPVVVPSVVVKTVSNELIADARSEADSGGDSNEESLELDSGSERESVERFKSVSDETESLESDEHAIQNKSAKSRSSPEQSGVKMSFQNAAKSKHLNQKSKFNYVNQKLRRKTEFVCSRYRDFLIAKKTEIQDATRVHVFRHVSYD